MKMVKRYRFNRRTLSYELVKVSPLSRLFRDFAIFAGSLLIFVFFMWMMSSVLHADLPKTFLLRMSNAKWQSRVEMLNRRMDAADASLDAIQARDDQVYRTLFGLGEIPTSVREAGIAGVNRYVELDEKNQSMGIVARRMDMLLKKAVVQSRSFDEVEALSHRSDEIAKVIPAICPISTEPNTFKYSSPFGGRDDPVFPGMRRRHTGIDLATYKGNPVYATGDGTVVEAEYNKGYGNCVDIDHGFGYMTRYAHLSSFVVKPGDRLHRGDHIGYVGSTGKSTGNHLHYEVLYRGAPINPIGFLDLEMPVEDYFSVAKQVPVEKGCKKIYKR